MLGINGLNEFLNKLDESKIVYHLDKIREESIMVGIAVPGQRWEVEFMVNGNIEVEKFISTGEIFDKRELDILFKDFSK